MFFCVQSTDLTLNGRAVRLAMRPGFGMVQMHYAPPREGRFLRASPQPRRLRKGPPRMERPRSFVPAKNA
jgi:hypothetical protein